MTLEEMKQHEWIVSWSGGKDSTATIILMHENNIPIKKIIYVRMMYDETLPATLPVMTDFVDNTKEVFESWGYPVEYIYTRDTASELINKVYGRSKHADHNGKKYGVTPFVRGHCWMARQKQNAIKKVETENEDCYQMVGYGADETKRLHRLDDKKQSIMLTLGVTEADAFEICKKYNLLSPLYDYDFYRDGCWFCPNAAKKQRAYLREYYPELVTKITDMIEMCEYDLEPIRTRNNWLKDWFKEKELQQER